MQLEQADILLMITIGLLYTLIRTKSFNIKKETTLMVLTIMASSLVNKFLGESYCTYTMLAVLTILVVKHSIKTTPPVECERRPDCYLYREAKLTKKDNR